MIGEIQKYTCYKFNGQRLGIIELKSNSDDLRKVFLDNKSVIKKAFPGTAFIKRIMTTPDLSDQCSI
jgi:hypothetical protein